MSTENISIVCEISCRQDTHTRLNTLSAVTQCSHGQSGPSVITLASTECVRWSYRPVTGVRTWAPAELGLRSVGCVGTSEAPLRRFLLSSTEAHTGSKMYWCSRLCMHWVIRILYGYKTITLFIWNFISCTGDNPRGGLIGRFHRSHSTSAPPSSRGVRKYRYTWVSRHYVVQYCIDSPKHCIDFLLPS